jgi:hypothetical protein
MNYICENMIDSILGLFFLDYPGLSYGFVDPLTAAMLLKAGSSVVKGVGNIITGRKDEKEAEEKLKELGREEDALKKKRTYGVSDTFNKYLAASKQDKASDLLRQQEKERFATNVGALSGGGAKALLGGLTAQSRQSAMQQGKIEAGAQNRQLDALKQYGAVEQAAMNRNVGLAASDLARTQGLMDNQEAARLAAKESKRKGITDTIQSGLNVAGDFADLEANKLNAKYGAKVYGNGGENKESEEEDPRITASEKKALRRDRRFIDKEERYNKKTDRFKADRKLAPNLFERRQRLLDAIDTRLQMDQSQRQLSMLNDSNLTAQERQRLIDNVQGVENSDDEDNEVPIVAADRATPVLNSNNPKMIEVGGMRVPGLLGSNKHGGVQKTPGKFSHATNPIDIMKDGSKIGEMTGGEYIFNPNQARTLEALASKGGSPLHKYVKGLLKEFDKR